MLVFASLVVLAFVAASLLNFWVAVRPPRIAIPGSPKDYQLSAEDVTIRADDGVALAGWLVARPGAPAVILHHGYPAEKADLLPLASALARRFTVLLVDLRYFGKSGGRVTTLGFRERADLARAVDFLERRGLGPVGVFGFSLGGAIALLAAAEDPRIRAVAAHSPFADLRVLGRDLYAFLWVLRFPLIELMVVWSRVFLGGDLTRPSPETAAERLGIPVLLIASPSDEQIPFHHAERLRRALARNANARFDFADHGAHGALGPGSGERLVSFFADHLAR